MKSLENGWVLTVRVEWGTVSVPGDPTTHLRGLWSQVKLNPRSFTASLEGPTPQKSERQSNRDPLTSGGRPVVVSYKHKKKVRLPPDKTTLSFFITHISGDFLNLDWSSFLTTNVFVLRGTKGT